MSGNGLLAMVWRRLCWMPGSVGGASSRAMWVEGQWIAGRWVVCGLRVTGNKQRGNRDWFANSEKSNRCGVGCLFSDSCS